MIKIVFFGSSKLSAEILRQLMDSGKFEVKAVVTQADKPVGRDKVLTSTPVTKIAEQKGIMVLKPSKLTPEFITKNREGLASDLFIVAAYGKIIPQAVLDIPKQGSINIHGSLLPKYRGASPIQSAILNGDEQTGVTIMLMDEQMDHGATLCKSEIRISKSETFASLEEKMAEVGGPLLIETIEKFLNGEIEPEVQDESKVTLTKLIKKDDGFFELENPPPVEKLDRMIRAYFPWPNVWTIWERRASSPLRSPRKAIGEAGRSFSEASNKRQGKKVVVKFFPEGRMQLEGKNIVTKEEFLRGYPEFPKL